MHVGIICTGNICRSPMGEVVLRRLVSDAGLSHITVSSAGTANWHVGIEMDERARAALDRAGFIGDGSLAAFADPDYLDRLDLIVVMTREHRYDVDNRRRRGGSPIVLMRSLVGEPELDLADPYYGDDDDFDQCLAAISRSCQELVRELHPGGAWCAA